MFAGKTEEVVLRGAVSQPSLSWNQGQLAGV